MGGEVEEENARAAGIEKGWSFSMSGSLCFVLKFLTESSCRKIGFSSGGPPVKELMSMSGFAGIQGRLLDRLDAELPGRRGATRSDNGISSESVSEVSVDSSALSAGLRGGGRDCARNEESAKRQF